MTNIINNNYLHNIILICLSISGRGCIIFRNFGASFTSIANAPFWYTSRINWISRMRRLKASTWEKTGSCSIAGGKLPHTGILVVVFPLICVWNSTSSKTVSNIYIKSQKIENISRSKFHEWGFFINPIDPIDLRNSVDMFRSQESLLKTSTMQNSRKLADLRYLFIGYNTAVVNKQTKNVRFW